MQATRITSTQQLRENGIANTIDEAMTGPATYAGFTVTRETADDVDIYRLTDGHNRDVAVGSKELIAREFRKLLLPVA